MKTFDSVQAITNLRESMKPIKELLDSMTVDERLRCLNSRKFMIMEALIQLPDNKVLWQLLVNVELEKWNLMKSYEFQDHFFDKMPPIS